MSIFKPGWIEWLILDSNHAGRVLWSELRSGADDARQITRRDWR